MRAVGISSSAVGRAGARQTRNPGEVTAAQRSRLHRRLPEVPFDRCCADRRRRIILPFVALIPTRNARRLRVFPSRNTPGCGSAVGRYIGLFTAASKSRRKGFAPPHHAHAKPKQWLMSQLQRVHQVAWLSKPGYPLSRLRISSLLVVAVTNTQACQLEAAEAASPSHREVPALLPAYRYKALHHVFIDGHGLSGMLVGQQPVAIVFCSV